jgi:hypothetical protein
MAKEKPLSFFEVMNVEFNVAKIRPNSIEYFRYLAGEKDA